MTSDSVIPVCTVGSSEGQPGRVVVSRVEDQRNLPNPAPLTLLFLLLHKYQPDLGFNTVLY